MEPCKKCGNIPWQRDYYCTVCAKHEDAAWEAAAITRDLHSPKYRQRIVADKRKKRDKRLEKTWRSEY